MLAYNETLKTFYSHINQNVIEQMIVQKLGFNVGESERRSFRMSLPAIANALRNLYIIQVEGSVADSRKSSAT